MGISSKVIYLSLDPEVPAHDYWDQTLLDDTLRDLSASDRQIVVIPGARQAHLVDDISMEIAQYSKVLVIITSDEENNFPVEKLYHPDMIIYVCYPSLPKHNMVHRFWPIGYPPKVKLELDKKKLPWFFAGQINHSSRENLAQTLRNMSLGKLVETDGFAKGIDYKQYMQNMVWANCVPAPGGPHSPDSFRLYEALETGSIPIPDNPEFWLMMFSDPLFPAVDDWSKLPDLINNLKDRPEVNNRVFAWWQRTKRQLRYNLEEDLKIKPEGLTVLIPTSPIPSHPSTGIIEQTINSVKERLPNSEIILMIDGVRNEQADRQHNYNEYIRQLLWKCNYEYSNVYPLLFETHQHQANMAREALKRVRTSNIVYVEHDTPLTGDIPFEQISKVIDSGEANLVRLHYEAQVLDVHKHLMPDAESQLIQGVPLMRCAQWSQRPHIASTEFYQKIINDYFPPTSLTMIEDRMYGVLENAWFTRKLAGWNEFKVWMYTPEGDIKRSLNLDGRADDLKYEMKYE